jgi:predicted metal-binding membrane protein
MATYAHTSRVRGTPRRPTPAVEATIAGAWLVLVVAQATGSAAMLHHHALIEGGTPLWVTLPVFLVAWEVMVAAMMLPASLPAIHAFEREASIVGRPRGGIAAYLGGYTLVWAAFGVAAFLGDVVLHHIVDTTPWLAARPWLIQAGVLALAGGYQFVPLKRRGLAASRHPDEPHAAPRSRRHGAARLGLSHGLACLGSSWALMLLMFAAGFGSLWWMGALTTLMVYEATGRHARRAASVAGIVLVLAAVTTLSGPWAVPA